MQIVIAISVMVLNGSVKSDIMLSAIKMIVMMLPVIKPTIQYSGRRYTEYHYAKSYDIEWHHSQKH
jgi:hypothetical protein